jgi:hypothetical protein
MQGRKALTLALIAAQLGPLAAPTSSARADWPFHAAKEAAPPSITDIARQIDAIQSAILNQGTVVIKQPDIWSQERMTQFRKEFEDTMAAELGKFTPKLAGRLARSDFAALQSETALAGVLNPFGKTDKGVLFQPEITSQESLNTQMKTTVGLITTNTDDDQPATVLPGMPSANAPAGSNFTLLNNIVEKNEGKPITGSSLGFSLEPNVELDQRADYINHLHRIRRVGLGDDNADSAGYGIYLMRVPISVQPGDKTVKGHGAIVNLTMRHDFGPGFLASTYRNLVINDVVDKLSGPVHEMIRSGEAAKHQKDVLSLPAKIRQAKADFGDMVEARFSEGNTKREPLLALRGLLPDVEDANRSLSRAELASLGSQVQSLLSQARQIITAKEVQAFKQAATSSLAAQEDPNSPVAKSLRDALNEIQAVERPMLASKDFKLRVDEAARSYTVAAAAAAPPAPAPAPAPVAQMATASKQLQDAATQFDDVARPLQEALTPLESLQEQLRGLAAQGQNLPIARSGVRINAIAPSDVPAVMGPSNLFRLAISVQQAIDLSRGGELVAGPDTHRARLADVRSYLRHELEAAYDILKGSDPSRPSVLMDVPYVESLADLVASRSFEGPTDLTNPNASPDNDLMVSYEGFIGRLPGKLSENPLGVLAWAATLEAALLNRQLRSDMKDTTSAEGWTCPDDVEGMNFYTPIPLPDAEQAFQDYVKARWPMITFALEPVVDQQNIEDAFTRRRDLQLAVAFALSSGRITFREAMRFTRQLQYEAQTIALNQTVSAFAHGNDTFGWRITPRYQTPPEESNGRAIANLLTRGGPGPNYQIKNAKIEPGQREMTAVVVMPSFVRGLRVDVSSDWFPLHDPDERKVHTARAVELGHKINCARQALASAQSCGLYRAEDIERLNVKLLQLERMLPLQTSHVKVPYENTLGGFALFTQGVTALVPELTGYEGVQYINPDEPTDIIVSGKHFSIYEMEVVAGGKALSREGIGQTLLDTSDPAKKIVRTIALSPLRGADGKILLIGSDGSFKDILDTGTYDVVSREVLRVRIPAHVATSLRSDNKQVVELYVATPNGISNRLQIPVAPEPTPKPTASVVVLKDAGYVFLDSGFSIQFDAAIKDNVITPTQLREMSKREQVRFQPTSKTLAPPKVNVELRFETLSTPEGVVAPIITVEGVEFNQAENVYILNDGHLSNIGKTLAFYFANAGIAVPTEVTTSSVHVTPVPLNDGESTLSARTTNNLKIKIEFVLGTNPTAATTNAAPSAQVESMVPASPGAKLQVGAIAAAERPAPALEPAAGDAQMRLTAFEPTPPAPAEPAAPTFQPIPIQDPPASPATGAGLTVGPITAPSATATAPAPAATAPSTPTAAPSTTSSTLVVMPPLPAAAPTVRVNVPIVNEAPKKHGLFHRDREPISPTNPARRSLLDRVRGQF